MEDLVPDPSSATRQSDETARSDLAAEESPPVQTHGQPRKESPEPTSTRQQALDDNHEMDSESEYELEWEVLDVWRDDLACVLDSIEQTQDLAAIGRYNPQDLIDPNIHVHYGGADPVDILIPLPLDEAGADVIKQVAREADLLNSDKTTVDHPVRNTWELDPGIFVLSAPAWPSFLNKILCDVSKEFCSFEADPSLELQALILYEKGSFHLPKHVETESEVNATLSIFLPSAHQGGEIHLSHKGKRRDLDTSFDCRELTTLVCTWDAIHHVKPLTEGHRLVLVYKIVQPCVPILAQDDQGRVILDADIRTALSQWPKADNSPDCVVYRLDYEYSTSKLRSSQLKGRDRLVWEALQAACAEHKIYCFLGNVSNIEFCSGGGWDYATVVDVRTSDGILLSKEISYAPRDILNCRSSWDLDSHCSSSPTSSCDANEQEDRDERYLPDDTWVIVLIPYLRLSTVFMPGCNYELVRRLLQQQKTALPEGSKEVAVIMEKISISIECELDWTHIHKLTHERAMFKYRFYLGHMRELAAAGMYPSLFRHVLLQVLDSLLPHITRSPAEWAAFFSSLEDAPPLLDQFADLVRHMASTRTYSELDKQFNRIHEHIRSLPTYCREALLRPLLIQKDTATLTQVIDEAGQGPQADYARRLLRLFYEESNMDNPLLPAAVPVENEGPTGAVGVDGGPRSAKRIKTD